MEKRNRNGEVSIVGHIIPGCITANDGGSPELQPFCHAESRAVCQGINKQHLISFAGIFFFFLPGIASPWNLAHD